MASKKRKGRQPRRAEAAETHVKRSKSLKEPAEPGHEDKSEGEQQDPPQKYVSEEKAHDEEEAEEESEEEEVAEEEEEEEEAEEEEEEEEEEDDEEETEEEEEKENEPIPKPTETKSAESADEEDEGEKGEEKEEVFKQAKREYESAKKKQKIDASPSQPSGQFSRIWSYDDELKLMQAVFQFHHENGRPPNKKECGLFHKSLKDINPAIQDKQVRNKIRTFRDAHSAWKRRGIPPFPPSNPNAEALFEMSKKMWGENVNLPMKVGEVHEISDDEEVVEANNINGANGEQNVKNKSKFPYTEDAIKELAKKDGTLLILKNSFKLMENSKAEKFEAKFKKQQYDHAKSSLNDLKLAAEFVKELNDLAK